MAEKACGVSRRLGQRGKGQSGNPLGRTMRQNMSKKRQNAGRNEGRRRADASLACVRSRPGCLPPEISRNEGYEVRFSPFFFPLLFFFFFFFKSRPSSSPELNHKVLVEGKEKVCFDD